MPRYIVTFNQSTEEIVTVDADSESEAEELVRSGEGSLLDYYILDAEVTDLVEDDE